MPQTDFEAERSTGESQQRYKAGHETAQAIPS